MTDDPLLFYTLPFSACFAQLHTQTEIQVIKYRMHLFDTLLPMFVCMYIILLTCILLNVMCKHDDAAGVPWTNDYFRIHPLCSQLPQCHSTHTRCLRIPGSHIQVYVHV